MPSRWRTRITIGAAVVAVAVVGLTGANWGAVREWWTGKRLEADPEYLLTLVSAEGEDWDLARLERILGETETRRLLGKAWFETFRRYLPQCWMCLVNLWNRELRDSCGPWQLGLGYRPVGMVKPEVVQLDSDCAPRLDELPVFSEEEFVQWEEFHEWLSRTTLLPDGDRVEFLLPDTEIAAPTRIRVMLCWSPESTHATILLSTDRITQNQARDTCICGERHTADRRLEG